VSAPLSPAEQATVARFDAGPDAPESLRERVALAIWNVDMQDEMTMKDWRAALCDDDRDFYREQADAAIAVITGGAA
jgi:hypothetical protein